MSTNGVVREYNGATPPQPGAVTLSQETLGAGARILPHRPFVVTSAARVDCVSAVRPSPTSMGGACDDEEEAQTL